MFCMSLLVAIFVNRLYPKLLAYVICGIKTTELVQACYWCTVSPFLSGCFVSCALAPCSLSALSAIPTAHAMVAGKKMTKLGIYFIISEKGNKKQLSHVEAYDSRIFRLKCKNNISNSPIAKPLQFP